MELEYVWIVVLQTTIFAKGEKGLQVPPFIFMDMRYDRVWFYEISLGQARFPFPQKDNSRGAPQSNSTKGVKDWQASLMR